TETLDGHFFGLSRVDVPAEMRAGMTLTDFEETEADGHFASVGLSWRVAEGWRAGASWGTLYERGTVAGIESSGAFSLGSEALTQYQGLQLAGKLSEKTAITTFYTRATTESRGTANSLFDAADGWTGDHYGVMLDMHDAVRERSLLRLSLLKPMQVGDGDVSVRVPVGREMDGTVIYDRRRSAFDGNALPL